MLTGERGFASVLRGGARADSPGQVPPVPVAGLDHGAHKGGGNRVPGEDLAKVGGNGSARLDLRAVETLQPVQGGTGAGAGLEPFVVGPGGDAESARDR